MFLLGLHKRSRGDIIGLNDAFRANNTSDSTLSSSRNKKTLNKMLCIIYK